MSDTKDDAFVCSLEDAVRSCELDYQLCHDRIDSVILRAQIETLNSVLKAWKEYHNERANCR